MRTGYQGDEANDTHFINEKAEIDKIDEMSLFESLESLVTSKSGTIAEPLPMLNKSVDLIDQSLEEKQDSDEAKANIGRKKEDMKMKKLMRDKLKVTNVPKMYLYSEETGEECTFSEKFDFHGFLGTGSFGFVVQAFDKTTKETIAIKVSYHPNMIYFIWL